ncbi:hypothetical protein C8F04DRAFT_1394608 [Mycena alexandri]|uniref:F-box domain-containing protein n=1 Tax=Mycena alexandri TaxID=1745969 RepID=A0AAD6X3N7_9AGAR|nr:hypothetical protein C8F04DRAFT_1120883 [Mycena alexandri]KAJ7035497.1 hypothetical protein C8F04DRAFT_1394608 [Mycena alexandri]
MAAMRLPDLPAEILLIIFAELYEKQSFPVQWDRLDSRPKSTAFESISNLLPLSVVNRRLRLLCLPIIFRTFRCKSLNRLKQLFAECTTNSGFAGLIGQLCVIDLAIYATANDTVLIDLLPGLPALVWLDIRAFPEATPFLNAVNSHPTLNTVAVRDDLSSSVVRILSSVNLPLSKILFSTTDHFLTFEKALPKVANLGARFSRVYITDESIDTHGAVADLHLLDLKQLEVEVCYRTCSNHLWLPNFAQRHAHLGTIIVENRVAQLADAHCLIVPFVPQFAEMVRNGPAGAWVKLNSFSISRPASWSSLKDWPVVGLNLTIIDTVGIRDLATIFTLAPQLTSLDIDIPVSLETVPISIHIVSFARPFSSLRFLRTLHLKNAYAHLHSNWATLYGSTSRSRDFSVCFSALRAMRGHAERIAEQAPALELILITDAGYDESPTSNEPWKLQSSYRVLHSNTCRDLHMIGLPKLEMAARNRLKP